MSYYKIPIERAWRKDDFVADCRIGLDWKRICMIRFECQVTAEPEPSLTWFYNDQPLTSGPRIQLTFDKTTTTLTILQAVLQDTGDYTCKATNSLGEATTKTFLRVRRKHRQ